MNRLRSVLHCYRPRQCFPAHHQCISKWSFKKRDRYSAHINPFSFSFPLTLGPDSCYISVIVWTNWVIIHFLQLEMNSRKHLLRLPLELSKSLMLHAGLLFCVFFCFLCNLQTVTYAKVSKCHENYSFWTQTWKCQHILGLAQIVKRSLKFTCA